MEAIDIAHEYQREISRIFDEMIMILYGSTVYGVNSSDLDLCFIREENLDDKSFENLVAVTRDFHNKYNLRIDEEVPYENKLIYTHSFIENTFENLPFPYLNGKYEIPKIEKTKEFLNSENMRKRLLLNILTVKRIVLNDSSEIIKKYSDKAWEIILKVVISYTDNLKFSLSEMMNNLYRDPFDKNDGEMYLGYKTNLAAKMIYLEGEVQYQLNNLVNDGKLIKTLKKGYIADKAWLNS